MVHVTAELFRAIGKAVVEKGIEVDENMAWTVVCSAYGGNGVFENIPFVMYQVSPEIVEKSGVPLVLKRSFKDPSRNPLGYNDPDGMNNLLYGLKRTTKKKK